MDYLKMILHKNLSIFAEILNPITVFHCVKVDKKVCLGPSSLIQVKLKLPLN